MNPRLAVCCPDCRGRLIYIGVPDGATSHPMIGCSDCHTLFEIRPLEIGAKA